MSLVTRYQLVLTSVILTGLVFTARRYAMRGICRRRVSVRLCVCAFTLWYYMKTVKHRITQITPHDSPVTLVY